MQKGPSASALEAEVGAALCSPVSGIIAHARHCDNIRKLIYPDRKYFTALSRSKR